MKTLPAPTRPARSNHTKADETMNATMSAPTELRRVPTAASRRRPGKEPKGSIGRASLAAGAGLLLMSMLSAFGYLVAVKGLVVPGSAMATARHVAEHGGRLRLGVLSLYVVAVLDVAVAWALYRVLHPVHETLAKVAAWLRVAYAGVFVLAILQLVGVAGMPTTEIRHINSFTNIWDAGLLLFGLDLCVLAYLATRSGYVPRLFGLLLAIAGFGYLFDSAYKAIVRGSSSDISALTGLGEFAFALWLVIRGRRITLESGNAPNGAAR